jgi:hypothetical protein
MTRRQTLVVVCTDTYHIKFFISLIPLVVVASTGTVIDGIMLTSSFLQSHRVVLGFLPLCPFAELFLKIK